jgi:homogentisate 1,2-dioxygenase
MPAPFDVGWDGYNFPYGFSIHILNQYGAYQPPPVIKHSKHRFVILLLRCMITIQNQFQPLQSSNIDSDEVLYYVDGDL